jgi:hypothetical protein
MRARVVGSRRSRSVRGTPSDDSRLFVRVEVGTNMIPDHAANSAGPGTFTAKQQCRHCMWSVPFYSPLTLCPNRVSPLRRRSRSNRCMTITAFHHCAIPFLPWFALNCIPSQSGRTNLVPLEAEGRDSFLVEHCPSHCRLLSCGLRCHGKPYDVRAPYVCYFQVSSQSLFERMNLLFASSRSCILWSGDNSLCNN